MRTAASVAGRPVTPRPRADEKSAGPARDRPFFCAAVRNFFCAAARNPAPAHGPGARPVVPERGTPAHPADACRRWTPLHGPIRLRSGGSRAPAGTGPPGRNDGLRGGARMWRRARRGHDAAPAAGIPARPA